MEITRNEAADLLEQAEAAGATVRHGTDAAPIGAIMILWGLIWTLCFTLTHFLPALAGWAWLVGDGLGILGTIGLAIHHPGARAVKSASRERLDRRTGAFWGLLLLFGTAWVLLFAPLDGARFGAFAVTLIMLGYVVTGLWTGPLFLVWLGLLASSLALGGYWTIQAVPALADFYDLWLAAVGGGALLAGGIRIAWRSTDRHG